MKIPKRKRINRIATSIQHNDKEFEQYIADLQAACKTPEDNMVAAKLTGVPEKFGVTKVNIEGLLRAAFREGMVAIVRAQMARATIQEGSNGLSAS